MKLKSFIAALFFVTILACNNEASVQDESDSTRHTDSSDSNWPTPGDMTGKDSIHSPETQSDTSIQTLQQK